MRDGGREGYNKSKRTTPLALLCSCDKLRTAKCSFIKFDIGDFQ